MRKVVTYSILLFMGLGLSQALPMTLGNYPDVLANAIRLLTLTGLGFIMIHVGFEFNIDKSNKGQYGWDYVVAFTAASFPWIFVTGYFLFVMLPPEFWGNVEAWKETLLAGRFAAPTSAGVLFSMLAAAGLGATWLFRKARILAIFDDLDTVLLMIPLKMLMVGLAWQLGISVVLMVGLLVIAYVWMHRVRMPVSWPWVLFYAALLVGAGEILYAWGKVIDPSVPIHIEILLPAFVVGCLARPRTASSSSAAAPGSPHAHEAEEALHEVLERPSERRAITVVSATFMVLVGLSMPLIFGGPDAQHPAHSPESLHASAPGSSVDDPAVHGGETEGRYTDSVTARQPSMGWYELVGHVLVLTVLSNLGKMFPAFCYRREAHWRERLALAIGMWPRGEVGAGVLVLSLSYGIGGPIVTVAMLSLALNLALTGIFIVVVRRLLNGLPDEPAADAERIRAETVPASSQPTPGGRRG